MLLHFRQVDLFFAGLFKFQCSITKICGIDFFLDPFVPGFYLGRDNCVKIFGFIEPGHGIIYYPNTIIAFFSPLSETAKK